MPSPSVSFAPVSTRKSSKYREYQAPVSPAAHRNPIDTFTYSADCQGAEGKSAVGLRPWSVQTLRALGAGSTTSDRVGAHRPALRLAWYEVMYRNRPRA